ncbi:hypothetical protein ACVHNB_19940 [Streptomyces sp. YJ-C3]
MKPHNLATKLTLAVTAATSLLLVATPAQASAGWDYIGTTDFGKFDNRWATSPSALSSGGDVKFCIISDTTKTEEYELWENDTTDDDYVLAVKGSGCWTVRDIGNYVDGDNNRAEFRIETFDSQALWVKWYD